MKVTGYPLYYWLNKLIAIPLGMVDLSRCLTFNNTDFPEGIPGCYGGDNITHTTDLSSLYWTLHQGGVEKMSYNTPATNLIASAYDLVIYALMIANNGELNGMRVLKTSSVDIMMNISNCKKYHLGCHGMNSFCVSGLGWCDKQIKDKKPVCESQKPV